MIKVRIEKEYAVEKQKEEKSVHETNQYDDYAFPVGVYRVTKESIVPAGRGYQDLHWHEELQLTMAISGTLTIQVNGIDYCLKQGEVIFINRNLLHITTQLDDGGRYVSLNFPEKILSFFSGSRMEQQFVLPYTNNAAFSAYVLNGSGEWQCEIISRLQKALGLIQEKDKPAWEYLLSMELTEIWYLLISHVKEQIKAPTKGFVRQQERIHRMLSFIHAEYQNNIRLSDIAASASVSPGECCRCFQNVVRMSPNQYLLNYRINQSMELLNNSSLSITEVAFACGFNDTSYFIQYFKKKNGLTPMEYRKSGI